MNATGDSEHGDPMPGVSECTLNKVADLSPRHCSDAQVRTKKAFHARVVLYSRSPDARPPLDLFCLDDGLVQARSET